MLVITYTACLDDVDAGYDIDTVEVLSAQTDVVDEFFLAPINALNKHEYQMLHRREQERKRIVRVVVLVSGILLLVSVALVTVSLYMAKDIDEMGTHFT